MGSSLLIAVTVAGLATLAPARLVIRQPVKDAVGYE